MKKIIKFILRVTHLYKLATRIAHYKEESRQLIRNFFFNFVLQNKLKVWVNVGKSEKKFFTMRGYTGSTGDRATHFYGMEDETPKWINTFFPNSNFLDVGANVGSYSLFAACLGHKVKSLEPESLNFALLNLNIYDNNFGSQIECFPICAGDKNSFDILNLSIMDWGKSAHTFGRKVRYDGKKFDPVYRQGSFCCSGSQFLEEINFKPDYIKIDVDGNELLVVKGLQDFLIKNHTKEILIEINENNPEHKDAVELLKSVGYEIQKIFYHSADNNYLFKKI
jgi:FkbM family methyltransferase